MPTTKTTWHDPSGDTWIVEFVEDDDTLVSVTVSSAGGDALPLTTLTRGIPYGELLDQIRQDRYVRKLNDGEQFTDSTTGRTWTVHGSGLTVHDDTPRPRRRKINRELMEEVAEVYNAAAGLRNPTEKVADHFIVSYSTAARWIMQARREPFNTLRPTTKGKST